MTSKQDHLGCSDCKDLGPSLSVCTEECTLREWLIKKDGYFYRPKKSGYTTSKFEAGRDRVRRMFRRNVRLRLEAESRSDRLSAELAEARKLLENSLCDFAPVSSQNHKRDVIAFLASSKETSQ